MSSESLMIRLSYSLRITQQHSATSEEKRHFHCTAVIAQKNYFCARTAVVNTFFSIDVDILQILGSHSSFVEYGRFFES